MRILHHMLQALVLTGASLMAVHSTAAEPVPQVSVGRIERLTDIAFTTLKPRPIDVWLPADYSPAKRYAVLYMHDGQMLFDARITWNKQSWNVHEAVDKLVKEGKITDTLIVGIWNVDDQRYAEYYPESFLARAPAAVRERYVREAQNGRSLSAAYLRFLVNDLKPAIDRRYSTRPGPESTAIMGSSMGGLISIAALLDYPQVFGSAAGLSTHWVGAPTAWGEAGVRTASLALAGLNDLAERLPPAKPKGPRLYTDRGTEWLEAAYVPAHGLVEDILREKGYGPEQAMTRVFPGTGHNERDWSARLDVPLQFLLGTNPAAQP